MSSWHGAFDLNCQSAALTTTEGGRGDGKAAPLAALGFQRDRETALTGPGGSQAGNLDKQVQIMTKMSWAVATAPGKQLPMMMFMMWMTGNGLHLFSIMMTGMALWTPVKSTMALNTAFQNIRVPGREISLTQQKLVYLGLLYCWVVYWGMEAGQNGAAATDECGLGEHGAREPVCRVFGLGMRKKVDVRIVVHHGVSLPHLFASSTKDCGLQYWHGT